MKLCGNRQNRKATKSTKQQKSQIKVNKQQIVFGDKRKLTEIL